MRRAAALAALLLALSAGVAHAQDSTGARRRPRTAAGAHLGGLHPRGPVARRPRTAPPAQDSAAAARPPAPAPRPDSVLPAGVSVQASVEPKTVTVGDRFSSGLALVVPAGTRVAVEVAKDTADRWRALDSVTVTPRDSAGTRWLAVVPMVAWWPGPADSVTKLATVRLTAPGGRTDSARVRLAFPAVRATLPADSTRWVVRPPHDVWGASRDWKRDALGAGFILLPLVLLATLLIWLLRRLRRKRVPATARERALAILERAETSGFIEAGNWKAFYTLVSEALRGFAAKTDPAWSTDLTSDEVIDAMRAKAVDPERVATLQRLLDVSDLAKFARRGRDADDARRDLADARAWIESFEPPASPEPPESADGEDAGAAREPAAAGAAP
jgi:hypothetical protein